jgi:hypothetical protein
MSFESVNPHNENNWSLITRERFLSPETKEKFLALKRKFPTIETRTRDEFIRQFSSGADMKPKIDIFRDDYEALIEGKMYNHNLEKVFDSTEYIYAVEAGQSPYVLGWSDGRGDVGAVFKDAQDYNGRTLGINQKSIIEAHEKTHGILEPLTVGEVNYILSCFRAPQEGSYDILHGYAEDRQAIELLIRMSQLKNYLGFKGEEEFTKENLDYVRNHYIQDTGLDNNMTEFFNAITEENEDQFIKLMNTIAC